MSPATVTVADLARAPLEVARALPAWQRGDHEEAALATLERSARALHEQAYTCWVWGGRTADGVPAWILPVGVDQARAFAPVGPARALVRSLAAATLADAITDGITFHDWRGLTLAVLPGLDEEIAGVALAEAHPAPARCRLAILPDPLDGEPITLEPDSVTVGAPALGVTALARATWTHPVRVALALTAHGQPVDEAAYSPEIVGLLRRWGCAGVPPAPDAPSLAIEDDPCPRRRHARRKLQSMLRMGKVGQQYHTEFDHLYRGAPADERRDALETGEALVRASLLGVKPSVGQRHVYLRREALPAIHALIERGETADPALAAHWTAPAPGAVTAEAAAPER